MKNIKPNLVMKNGAVYTVDKENSWADAVALAGDQIIFVGSFADIEPEISSEVEVIDLGGKMVLPSFVDAHTHPSHAVDLLENISLYNLDSLEKYTQTMQEFISRHPERDFYRGSGWDNTLFSLQGPEKGLLDELMPSKPVSLGSYDGHSLWVNSATLDKAGITKDTPDPHGGVIERFPESGDPTGTLRETAMKLVDDVIPGYSAEEKLNTLRSYQKMAFQCGVTMCHDAILDADQLTGYKDLEAAGALRMNMRGSILIEPDRPAGNQIEYMLEQRASNRHPKFQTNTAKLFVDGVVEGGTAYLLEPYANNAEYYGELIWEPGALNEICVALDKEQVQIHIHIIGDAAARIALDALEFAQEKNGTRDARHMITHLQLVAPEDILRFHQLDVIGLPNPYWFKIDEYYHLLSVPYLGEERAKIQYPMRSFLEAGVRMASASDFPVTVPFDPLIGMEIGVTRSPLGTITEEILWPEERVSLEAMVASFTINGAYANFLESQTGSLEVGKRADFVVLDQNIYNLQPNEIAKAKVLQTYLDGEEVYNAEGN
jgi:predicted amidohydrolase YtcJ